LSEVRFSRINYEEVTRKLREYAGKAVAKGALAVILIGSLARGDYTARSDADVVVIVESDSRRPIDRIADYIDPTMPIDVEPRVYTLDEVRRMARRKAGIVREILEVGVLLAGDPRVLDYLRGELEE